MEMKERRIQSEQAAAVLLERKQQVEEKVKYLSDERGIETEMRRQFDVALEGEKVVVILKEKEEDLIKPLVASSTEVVSKKWYQFWR